MKLPPLAVAGGFHLLELLSATDIGATAHRAARFLSVEKRFDEISATGGHRIFSPSTATGVFRDQGVRIDCDPDKNMAGH